MRRNTIFSAKNLFLIALWGCIGFAARAKADDGTFSYNLNRNESLLLEQLVCEKPFGVAVASIDARAFEANASHANYADVKCRPHAKMKGQPLYYVAQCIRADGQWTCARAEVETQVPIKDRSLFVRPGSVPSQRAFDAIQKISKYGFFQGKSVDAALQSTCNMGMGETPDLVEIACHRWSITVSFWCPATPEKNCPRIIYMAERN